MSSGDALKDLNHDNVLKAVLCFETSSLADIWTRKCDGHLIGKLPALTHLTSVQMCRQLSPLSLVHTGSVGSEDAAPCFLLDYRKIPICQ